MHTVQNALLTRALQADQVWSQSVMKEGHFTVEAKQFFVPISPRITAELARQQNKHSFLVWSFQFG
jgi:hypothetical protein